MDSVTIGIFVVCGLLVGGAIALRRPKVKVPDRPAEGDAGPTDIDLKLPDAPDAKDDDRELE
jgi:hypothetical protein